MTEQMTGMMTEDDFFEHFGKKGMKWGVRKSAPSHTSADAARYKKINSRVKKNGIDNLSNDDIAKLNKRNQLLSEYKRTNPSTVKLGADGVKTALSVVKVASGVAVAGLSIAALVKSPEAKVGALAVAQLIKKI